MDLQQDLWLLPSGALLLKDGDVHVWRADLEQEPSTVEQLFNRLSSEERQRAAKYYFVKDREHFIVARGVLRGILGRYLGVRPERIRFSYNRFGKPSLNIRTDDNLLRFNVSHSRGIALYALTWGHEIGLDIEYMRQDIASLEIARNFFSPFEVSVLSALPASLQPAAFFNCWTRKEAYIKAIGTGLSQSLQQFTVSMIPGEPARLLRTINPEETQRWSLIDLSPHPDYKAALVVEGTVRTLSFWQCSHRFL